VTDLVFPSLRSLEFLDFGDVCWLMKAVPEDRDFVFRRREVEDEG
jgi:hypothetical protein